ncbi:MAG: hypothetical protein AAGG02_00050 [Cyanobacteria bacterium P01_H01_bin.15]
MARWQKVGILFGLTIILSLSWLKITWAEEETPPYEARIDSFFALLQDQDSQAAVTLIYENADAIAEQAVETVRERLETLSEELGQVQAFEQIQAIPLGKRFIHLTYLSYFERLQPLRFEFQFYRPDDEWKPLFMGFDDAFDEDIKAYARRQLVEKPGESIPIISPNPESDEDD